MKIVLNKKTMLFYVFMQLGMHVAAANAFIDVNTAVKCYDNMNQPSIMERQCDPKHEGCVTFQLSNGNVVKGCYDGDPKIICEKHQRFKGIMVTNCQTCIGDLCNAALKCHNGDSENGIVEIKCDDRDTGCATFHCEGGEVFKSCFSGDQKEVCEKYKTCSLVNQTVPITNCSTCAENLCNADKLDLKQKPNSSAALNVTSRETHNKTGMNCFFGNSHTGIKEFQCDVTSNGCIKFTCEDGNVIKMCYTGDSKDICAGFEKCTLGGSINDTAITSCTTCNTELCNAD